MATEPSILVTPDLVEVDIPFDDLEADERDVVAFTRRQLDAVAAQARRRADERNRKLAAENAQLRAQLERLVERLESLYPPAPGTAPATEIPKHE